MHVSFWELLIAFPNGCRWVSFNKVCAPWLKPLVTPLIRAMVPNRGLPDTWGSETTFSEVRNAIFEGESLYVIVGYTFFQNSQDL